MKPDEISSGQVVKYTKRRNENLKYDFMPELIEIIERPSHIAGKIIIYSIFSFLIVAIVWSALAKVDIVVYGAGVLEPVGGEYYLQSTESGKIVDNLIKEGKYVSKDEKLLTVENTYKDILKDEAETNDIKSPIDGYINQVKLSPTASVVNLGQELVTIIPKNSKIEMKCQFDDKDISNIKVGSSVEIKLEAYPYSDYGTIPAKIIYISPGAIMDENGNSVYEVKVEINNKSKNIKLIPGLTGTAETKVGKRSVLSYFLEPITSGLKNSIKEK